MLVARPPSRWATASRSKCCALAANVHFSSRLPLNILQYYPCEYLTARNVRDDATSLKLNLLTVTCRFRLWHIHDLLFLISSLATIFSLFPLWTFILLEFQMYIFLLYITICEKLFSYFIFTFSEMMYYRSQIRIKFYIYFSRWSNNHSVDMFLL